MSFITKDTFREEELRYAIHRARTTFKAAQRRIKEGPEAHTATSWGYFSQLLMLSRRDLAIARMRNIIARLWRQRRTLSPRIRSLRAQLDRAHSELSDVADALPLDDWSPGECTHAQAVARIVMQRDKLRDIDVCWHCGDELSPQSRTRPRCYRCPDECDDATCDAYGCREEGVGDS